MVKLTIFYGQPKDPEAFEAYYSGHHIPEYVDSGKLPKLVRIDMAKGVPRGDEAPPFYRTADLWYESPETAMADAQSAGGQEAMKDLENFATGGFQLMVSLVETKEGATARNTGSDLELIGRDFEGAV